MEKINKKLTLFFTYGVSLEIWEKKGMFERELKVYKELSKDFDVIYFVTYGKHDDKYQEFLSRYNIKVLYKNKYNFLPNFIYSLVLPFIYKKQLSSVDFIKTNQMLGSWSAVIAKFLYKKILIVRTGYTLSIFSKRVSKVKWFLSKIIEFFSVRFLDKLIVATQSEKEYFGNLDKISVIPNYVDTEIFKPMPELKNPPSSSNLAGSADAVKKIEVLFIGRLNKQKNLKNAIKALSGLDNIKLNIIGSGELKEELKKLAEEKHVDVEFLGNKPHDYLPKYINNTDFCLFPSLYEGNPKVLLEMMACGMPIVATNVSGINNIVTHKKDAIVVGILEEEIRAGIKLILNDKELKDLISKNALQNILESYSFNKIIELERKNYGK